MGGQVLFQDALTARLDIIKPSRADIDCCMKTHPLKLTNGVKEFIHSLYAKGVPVYLISGGFKQASSVNYMFICNTTLNKNLKLR
jgi:phosphoserine phosphatase